jgi:hypothetical protein
MGRFSRFITVAALAAAILAAPAAAQAVTRFATPNGGATFGSCTLATKLNPKCRIDHAVAVAQAGDTVALDAGTYTLASTLPIATPITLRPGDPRAARPVITFTASADDTVQVAASGAGTTIRGVEVDQRNSEFNSPASAVRTFGATTLTDVILDARGVSGPASVSALEADADTTLSVSTARADNSGGGLDGVSVSGGHKLTLRDDLISYGTGTLRPALGGIGSVDADNVQITTGGACVGLNSPTIVLRDIQVVQVGPPRGTLQSGCIQAVGHATITGLHVSATGQDPAFTAVALASATGQGGVTATDISVDAGGTALAVGGDPGTQVTVRRARLTGSNGVVTGGVPSGQGGPTLLLTDSLAHATGRGTAAVAANPGATVNVRHTDALSDASIALRATGCQGSFLCSGPGRLDAQNVIARGGLVLEATCNDPCTQPVARMSLNHANFNPTAVRQSGPAGATALTLGAGNQDRRTQPPVLTDGLHQAASSPTRDHGAPYGKIGPTDIDGDPRTLGAATDIGADEFVP